MNYKFLSAVILAVCMYTSVKADAVVKVTELPKSSESILKIGYVDYLYVLENLSEAKKHNADIQSFQKQLENQIQTKYKEYQEKAESVQQQLDTFTEAQKKQKFIEMNKLQAAIQELEEQKYAKMERKYKEVMKPLHDRIQEVINKIAEEHHYTFVLNKSTDVGPIVFFAHKAFDLSELVVEKIKAIAPEAVKVPVIGPKNNETAKVPAKAAAKATMTKKK